MWSFFDGWRRKAGVVTLVIALASCGGWIRSFEAVDGVIFSIAEAQYEAFSSTGNIHLLRWRVNGEPNSYYIATDRVRYGSTLWDCAIPHWSVAIPLTLLSAYLILWKPQKAKSSDQPAISNPISN